MTSCVSGVVIQQLREERAKLKAQLGRRNGSCGEPVGYGNHQADDAAVVFEQTMELALRCNQEHLLAQIKDALQRFQEGTYGMCQRCGEEIDPARLRALPYTPLCIKCKRGCERNGVRAHTG